MPTEAYIDRIVQRLGFALLQVNGEWKIATRPGLDMLRNSGGRIGVVFQPKAWVKSAAAEAHAPS